MRNGIKFGIKIEIDNKITREYTSTIKQGDSLTLKADPGKSIDHRIRHKSKWVKGYIEIERTKFLFTKEREQVPFEYCYYYDIEKAGQKELRCPRPSLKIDDHDIYPRSSCRNNHKNYAVVAKIENSGDRDAEGVDVSVIFQSPVNSRRRQSFLVMDGTVASDSSITYRSLIDLYCPDFPANRRIRVKMILKSQDHITKERIHNDSREFNYRLLS